MNVLVDTDVWSEAFRKKGEPSNYVRELVSLVEEGRVQLIGPIRQEILCGIRCSERFAQICKRLDAFPDRPIDSSIYVMAAQFFNLCRSRGIQGSNTDFLICACSVKWRFPILSKDQDYIRYKELLPLELLLPRGM
ncbi:MAG TPA: PIN domain nuclease [Opitutae bacterium]|nr:PIN domain nuclease [Opitutae bacterium]